MAFSYSKPHYELLDGLRGVAALFVVWYHVFEGFQFAGNKPTIEFINHGYLAVDFFFILSGFVIGYAYDGRWDNGLTFGGFLRRRLIRLHPMVVFGAIFGALSFFCTGMERWDGSHSTIALTMVAVLCGCLMIPALPGMPRDVRGNGELFPLNGPCWSLFFEYIGNIVYATVIRRLSTKAVAALAAALCCALTWFAITDQSGYGSIGVGWTADKINIFGGTLRMMCPFTIGILLSRIFTSLKHSRGAFWICSAALVIVFHVPYIEGREPFSLNGIFEAVCVIIVFPAIVWIAASGKATDTATSRICTFLGDISFPLYITHYPLMYAFYMWMIKTEQYTLSQTWPIAIAVVTGSIAIAWLALRFYELPIRRYLTSHK